METLLWRRALRTPRASGVTDRFLSGPLADPAIADDRVRSAYQRLTYPNLGSKASRRGLDDEAEVEVDELPASQELVRPSPLAGLFDYQLDLVRQIEELARRSDSNPRALVALPTGAGKTRTAVAAMLQLLSSGTIRQTIWLAPGRELLDQAFETFVDLWNRYPAAPDVELFRAHALSGFPSSTRAAVYFATPQMLAARLKKRRVQLPEFDFLVFDEAHQAAAPVFADVFKALTVQTGRAVPGIGLSATPGRSADFENMDLVELFGGRLLTSHHLGRQPVTALQERGILAHLKFRDIALNSPKSSRRLSVRSHEDMERGFRNLEYNVVRFAALVRCVMELPEDERTIVFAGSIAHANAIACVLRGKGVPASVLSSRTPFESRTRILQSFRSGELRVLVNKTILATGYDCPAVTSVVLGVPIGSPILFEQMVGRASRGPAVGGNSEATVWQLDDHLALHGPPISYERYRDFDWK